MNAARYMFDQRPVLDFPALCACFGGRRLQSPYRSTVPLLSLVHHSRADWLSLLDLWNAPPESYLHFEYCVPSSKPGGNPSQTDAMVICPTGVWAVEAKWTEPRDHQTVAKRLNGPDGDATVMGWLHHLQPFATRPLKAKEFEHVGYQLVHRAASACAVATLQSIRPALVYLHFHPSPLKTTATLDYYVQELRALRRILGQRNNFVFQAVELPLRPMEAFQRISNLPKGLPTTAKVIVAELCAGRLFTFGAPAITTI